MEERATPAAHAIGLTADDYAQLTNLYNTRLRQLGVTLEAVGWGTLQGQALRFEVLCRQLNLQGQRVLDIGCGLGDFVPWAEARYGADFEYVGIDLAEDLIGAAQARFGGPGRKFIADTLGPDSRIGDFDIVISSGAMSFRISDNIKTMRRLLSEAWARTRQALCVNFLSTYVDFELEKNFHYSPEEVFAFAKTLSRWVMLHHDYPLYEFTIQVFRQPRT